MLARDLRRELEEMIGAEYGELAVLLGSLRGEVKRRLPTVARRRAYWRAALDLPLRLWMRNGEHNRVRTALVDLLAQMVENKGDPSCAS